LGRRLFNDALSSPARTKRLLRRLPKLMRALSSKIHPGLRKNIVQKSETKATTDFPNVFDVLPDVLCAASF
jgi:hypothetical protein